MFVEYIYIYIYIYILKVQPQNNTPKHFKTKIFHSNKKNKISIKIELINMKHITSSKLFLTMLFREYF
jgi:hypothetical protein